MGIGLASVGGTGSAGGSGGIVSVSNAGSITTQGDLAKGIFAQSVGGGGGSGGSAGSLLVSIGGSGSGAGTGGTVNVTHSGFISTAGAEAIGIQAQSVGGGGGSAGGAITVGSFVGVALGGSGSGGGAGGNVTLNFQPATINGPLGPTTANPSISTAGRGAHGVLAQSVGGGGGNGGFATAAGLSVGAGGSFAIGGTGGAGGSGGLVNLGGNVSVTTAGANAHGILAQSVGGGGGNGGLAVAVQLTSGAAFSLGIGGAGGNGGVGGNVSANTGGTIATQGDFSTGFTAQSVGGGGGNGGMSVSVAGSGGLATVSVAAGFGGQGGLGGSGGTVLGNFLGQIRTSGHDAGGAVVQSLGGGGGSGGFNIAAAMDASKFGGVSAAVGFGGTGGNGGAGGTVTGTIGSAATVGNRSNGVTIQSVGGGGGAGGFNVSGAVNATVGVGGAAAIGFGGAGGGGGAGGTVTGTVTAGASTEGDQSTGVAIQSLGGGGGAGGFNIAGSLSAGGTAAFAASVGFGGSGGGGGSAGTAGCSGNDKGAGGGGGGGSSYIGGVNNGAINNGIWLGNGLVSINYEDPTPAMAVISTAPTSACAGEVLTFSCDLLDEATFYTWTVSAGATFLSGQNTNTITVQANSDFTVDVYGVNGNCTLIGPASTTLNVTVLALPNVSATATESVVCLGESTTLNASGADSYTWSNGVTNGIAFAPAGTLTYTVTGTALNGCENDANITVTVNPLPTVGLTASMTGTFCGGQDVTLTGTPAGGTYTQTAGPVNALTSNIFNAPQQGSYTVSYAYTDANGCTNTSTEDFEIDCMVGLDLISKDGSMNVYPNPNNGNFTIKSDLNEKGTLELFNMSGQLVHTQEIENLSEKMIEVKNLTPGVYTLTITAGEKKFTGNLNIIK